MKKTPSIRSRLTQSLLIGAGIMILVVAGLLDYFIGRFLWARFDAELLNRAQALVALTDEDEEGVDFDFDGDLMPEFEAPEGPEFFELWLAGGVLLGRSESLANGGFSVGHDTVDSPRFEDIVLPEAGRCRLVRLSFLPRQEFGEEDEEDGPAPLVEAETEAVPDVAEEADVADVEDKANALFDPSAEPGRAATLLLARKSADFDALLFNIRLLIWGALGLLLLVVVILVRYALGKGLEPLDEIGGQVKAIDPDSLDARVSMARPVVELMPIVAQLNALLARLEAAVARERRFTSDVAHELRTPLAELRTLAEVGVKDPGDLDMTRAFFSDVREITLEMQRLATDLLELTRCDSGTQTAALEDVDASAVLDKAWKRAEAAARERGITLDNRFREAQAVRSDPALLERIVQNLVNNAVTYSPAGSVVAVEGRNGGDRVSLTISNPAPDLGPDDLSRLFERFWQKDAARTGGQSAGLGLSLVHSLAKLLNIEIKTQLSGGRLSFSLILPAALMKTS